MNRYEAATAVATEIAWACNCIGPQNGQPLCPCKMRHVVVKDGRYVRPEQDLGPVPAAPVDGDAAMGEAEVCWMCKGTKVWHGAQCKPSKKHPTGYKSIDCPECVDPRGYR